MAYPPLTGGACPRPSSRSKRYGTGGVHPRPSSRGKRYGTGGVHPRPFPTTINTDRIKQGARKGRPYTAMVNALGDAANPSPVRAGFTPAHDPVANDIDREGYTPAHHPVANDIDRAGVTPARKTHRNGRECTGMGGNGRGQAPPLQDLRHYLYNPRLFAADVDNHLFHFLSLFSEGIETHF